MEGIRMNKCPICQSTNLEHMNTSYMTRRYEKVTHNSMMTSTEEGTYSYPIIKSLCLDCGYIYESMSQENLNKYSEEKQYFKNY